MVKYPVMNTTNKNLRSAVAAALAIVAANAFAISPETEALRLKYPDADSVLLDMSEDIAYNPDGTYVCDSRDTLHILTEKGRREDSEIDMRFSRRYCNGEIISVTVTSEDGTVREIDVPSIVKEATDNSSASENIYDPMARKLVCSIPGVKVGDKISYHTRRTVFASRIQDQWADTRVLEWSCPIVNASIRIKSPAERPLKNIALRHPLGNVTYSEETLADGSVVRTWTAKDSPQMFPEPDMPPQHTQVQALHVSTAQDWKEISRWYWNISLPHLEKTTPAITNKVEEIGRDISAIYKWVAQEVRYMGLTMEDTSPGYAPHDVNITFENRYGVCRDKAALLVAMLRIAGFEAYPVLIHAGAKMDPEVPMPYFNHAIASVADGKGGYILMDPTDESSRDLMPAYLSDKSYLVARPEGETLLVSPVPGAENNAVKIKSECELQDDGSVIMESTVRMSGINDNAYRQGLLRRKKEARRKMFERSLMALAPGAELLGLEITPEDLQDTAKPLEMHIKARLPGVLVEGERCAELSAPFLSRILGAANWILEGKTSLEKRKYPLVIDSTAMTDEELAIRLNGVTGPEIALPHDISIEGPYACERKSEVKDGVLKMTRRFAVNAVEFAPEQYQEMRENIKKVEAAERERAIFAKRRFAGANARIILDETKISISSPRSWVVTNNVIERVLSYDGKKKLSELTFDFNPAWQKVEVVSAVVSNTNGKVVKATEREMNVFDCSWAAGAPRYPASKRLIVNLPGVEAGSVISYTVVTTVENAPVEFYMQRFFDSQEPTDRVSVEVNGETWQVDDAKLISAEPMTASGELWRESVTISSNDFAAIAKRLAKAADPGRLECDAEGAKPWGESIKSIRDWMAKNVRVAGPSLYETQLEAQMTPPATVVAERYASRLDYIRTMCALLRGARFDADIVFSSLDAESSPVLAHRDMYEKPCATSFAYPLCRVRERKGGFLFLGGTEVEYFIGTENEYAPLGATAYDGSHYFDPEDGAFGTVKASSDGMKPFARDSLTMFVRENGAVDFEVEYEYSGPGVAAFRKKYEEMLPEDRERHYQELLGEISQAATATGELVTDTESYPAKMSFKAFVPNYAIATDGELLTVPVPAFLGHMFPLSGDRRRNPVGVAAADPEETEARIVFPKGYGKVEHLPEQFAFANPVDAAPWYSNRVSQHVDSEGRLVVTITRRREKRLCTMLSPDFAPLLRNWSLMGNCRANRTVSVRKTK